MNPEPTLTALELPLQGQEGDTYDSVVKRIQDVVKTHNSTSLDSLMNEQYKQAGTIAWTSEEFLKSAHGKANEHVGLYSLVQAAGPSQPASWWPEQPSMPSSPQRPLAGLKIVDLTRVIAAPTITRSLAEMGASVMRVTTDSVTDAWGLHQDLNWGKWNASLDLKKNAADREALAALIREADVVVEGYRPGAMARNGFGREEIFKLVEGRDRGIVHVRENCYGWNGPWAHRSGWQQISDAVSTRFFTRSGWCRRLMETVLRCEHELRKGHGQRRSGDARLPEFRLLHRHRRRNRRDAGAHSEIRGRRILWRRREYLARSNPDVKSRLKNSRRPL